MEIKFYGHACFGIQDSGITVITDPYSEKIGLKLPALKADAITVSHNAPAYNNADAIDGEPKVFSWPGEYETKGVHFRGIHSFHNAKEDEEQLENIVNVMHFNGIKICHLGAQGTKLTPEQLEQVGDVDILLVPVGGKTVLGAKKAKEIIEQIEPRVVIPMVYATDGSNFGCGPLSEFIKEMGTTLGEPLDSFKVKRSELPDDNSKVVVLNQAA